MSTEATAHDEFYDSLLGDFLDESGQLLDRLNENLLQLDEWVRSLDEDHHQRCDDALMNEMFRSAHSLKGLSAMLGLKDINSLTHRVENVFDAARKEQLVIRGDVVELMFQAVDRLVNLVEALKDPRSAPVDWETVAEGIHRVLQEAGAERQQTSQADAERALGVTTAHEASPSASDARPARSEAPGPRTPPSPTVQASQPEPAGDDAQQDPPAPADAAPAADSPVTPVQALPATAAPRTADDPAAPAPQGDPKASITPAAVVDLFDGLCDETEINDKYLTIFLDETWLTLDELTETLLAVEGRGTRAAMEKLLVTSHRIKGSAASVGLNRAAKLAHLMEDLMQNLLEKGSTLPPRVADALLRCTDGLRQYIDNLRRGGPRCDQFSDLARELAAAQLEGPTSAPARAVASETPAMAAAQAPLEGSVSDQLRSAVSKAAWDGAVVLAGEVTFPPGLALVGLKARLLYEKLCNLGEICYFHPPADQLDELDELDKVHFGLVTEKGIDLVQRQLRFAGIAQITIETIQGRAAGAPGPGAGARQATPPQQASADVSPRQQSAPAKSPPAAAKSEKQPEAPAASKASDAAGASRESGKPNETLRVDIERLDQLMNLAGQLVINKARFARIGDNLKNLISGKQSEQSLRNACHLLERMAATGEASGSLQAELDGLRMQARRVQHDLQCVCREVEALGRMQGAINELGEAVHQLDRVTDGIQRSVMDTRMVPIGPLFARFKRVVRDITRTNGKSIRLVVNGEKTELDKRMIDELGDPLIHMVRNSADHGIESAATRLAAGKPAEGTITMDAFHRGNSILIQVSDDGKGLDADRILKKAIEKGLVSSADAERMSRQQIYQLIWEPGLSTAEKITEVSGRGMGMDIVKSKIEALNGTIDLDSTPGRGTTMTIKLPLTLAILPSLMVEIEGDVFAMPVEAVVEIVTLEKSGMSRVHGQRTAVVRGRVVSLIGLQDVFSWSRQGKTREDDSGETTMVIVGEKGQELGLIVDRVLGEEDIVIKSMAENYRNIPGIAGASILGDGRVSLILDILAMIDMASQRLGAAVTT